MTCVGNNSWSRSRVSVCMTFVGNKSFGHSLKDWYV